MSVLSKENAVGQAAGEGEKRFPAPQKRDWKTEHGITGGGWIILHLGVP